MHDLSGKSSQNAKLLINELFIRYLTIPQTGDFIRGLIDETVAASLPQVHMQPGEPSPSPPVSPPRQKSVREAVLDSVLSQTNRTPSPVHVSTRFLGVDEVDMATHQRSTSPGAASPISPNSALMRHNVDPHLPHPIHDSAAWTVPSPASKERASNSTVLSSSLQEEAVKGAKVPKFYFKSGAVDEDPPGHELDSLNSLFARKQSLSSAALGVASRKPLEIDAVKILKSAQFGRVCTDVFQIPSYMKDIALRRVLGVSSLISTHGATYEQVRQFYTANIAKLSPKRRLFEFIRQDHRQEYLLASDLRTAVRELVDNHPGLAFLTQPEFQELYCQTVAVRMLYQWERSTPGRIAWSTFDGSDITDTMMKIDGVNDINQILCYFTYEHFYVLYCRFWELDTDRDYYLSLADLQQYSRGGMSQLVLQRVISGAGRRMHAKGAANPKMDFEDFIYFCLSEEDKNSPSAIRYWFNILDLDEDGVLSGFELQHFFSGEHCDRMLQLLGEEIRYDDLFCQMIDMLNVLSIREFKGITLADLRRCPNPAPFFDLFLNTQKFVNYENRDPFADYHMKSLPEKTDWDRFARAEYDRMASEAS